MIELKYKEIATFTAHLINEFAKEINAQSYLEIGVLYGNTILNVDIEKRFAVDLCVPFYFKEFDLESHQVSSDEFFINNSKSFDIIFIDGYHDYEHVKRDLNNSLKCLNENGIIIIDDVVPIDELSAMTTQSEEIQARLASGGSSTAWFGDVYKVLFDIHDDMPELDYLILNHYNVKEGIIEFGNGPKAIVWKSESNRTPIIGDVDKIANVNFNDFIQCLPLMQQNLQNFKYLNVLNRVIDFK